MYDRGAAVSFARPSFAPHIAIPPISGNQRLQSDCLSQTLTSRFVASKIGQSCQVELDSGSPSSFVMLNSGKIQCFAVVQPPPPQVMDHDLPIKQWSKGDH
eukprot:2330625-Amphidinium_carterae.1